MDGRVDDAHVLMLLDEVQGEGETVHFLKIDVIELLVEDGDEVGVALEVDHRGVGDFLHLGNDVLVVRADQLTAVVPIGLIAVVFLGIV